LKRLLDPTLSTEGRGHGSKIPDSAAFVLPQRIELVLKSRPNEIYRSL
jgi:hypothetical protein